MNLLQELNKTKNRIGLVSGSLKINEYDDAEENITACINPEGWHIEFNLKKGFEPVKYKKQKIYARQKKIKDSKRQMLEDILHHELAHWELPFNSGLGCPYDVYNHDLILEAVKEALPEDKQEHASYAANAFEDLIVNSRAKQFTGNFSGQVLFFDEQGAKLKKQKYTPFYEAFVRLNMHLWGDGLDKKLLQRHYNFKNRKKVEIAVNQVISELSLEKNMKDLAPLFYKENWQALASKFASALAPLLEVPPKERLSAYQDKNGKEGQSRKKSAGHGLEQKLGTKEGKEEIAFGRYSSNKAHSPNLTSYEQLDSLYRRLARAIPVEVEAMVKEHSLPITPLNYRPFDEEKDDPAKIKTSKLFLDDKGSLTFAYPKEQLTINAKSKIQRRSFPDFKLVVLDNSGSMAEGINGNQGNTVYIPWGDNSKYHYALLGFYGIEQFLQMQGIAQYIGHGMSLFSSSTRYQETDFQELQKLRKLALSPEFGGTRLDAKTLTDSLRGRESFVLSISDGEIQNWPAQKNEFEKLAKENYFAHIQIGPNTRFSRDLKTMGLPVFPVNSGEELSRLMVSTALNTYKKFIQPQQK